MKQAVHFLQTVSPASHSDILPVLERKTTQNFDMNYNHYLTYVMLITMKRTRCTAQ